MNRGMKGRMEAWREGWKHERSNGRKEDLSKNVGVWNHGGGIKAWRGWKNEGSACIEGGTEHEGWKHGGGWNNEKNRNMYGGEAYRMMGSMKGVAACKDERKEVWKHGDRDESMEMG